MTQLAPLPSRPAPPLASSDADAAAAAVAVAIDRYLAGACAGLDRVLAGVTLLEPPRRDPVVAARMVARLVETLAGLALGGLVGPVLAAIRRGFGAAIVAEVEAALRDRLGAIVPPAPAMFGLDDGPVRSVAVEARQTLRRRMAHARAGARALLGEVAGTIAPHGAGELRVAARTIALVADEPLVAERYAVQVAEGWACALAAIRGEPAKPSDEPLWRHWQRRVRGLAEAAAPLTRADLAAQGYVMQIG
jgi:hypothetical protein